MKTAVMPQTRTRTNFTQSAKGEWRIAEITIELTDHDDPVSYTSDMLQDLLDQLNEDVQKLNASQRHLETLGQRT